MTFKKAEVDKLVIRLGDDGKNVASNIAKFASQKIHKKAAEIWEKIWKYCPIWKCDTFQKDMASKLDAEGIKYEKIHIQSTEWMKQLFSVKYNDFVSTNWNHYAIKIDNKIYDNLNPKWIDIVRSPNIRTGVK